MLIQQINLNHLRVFEAVFRHGSMTTAAKELHLTQSGLSQHIQSLEETLGIKLFDRVKHRLIGTPQGAKLYSECAKILQDLEKSLTQITGKEQELQGTVHIGVPMEFANNSVIPKLVEFSKKHPRVQFKLTKGFALEMNQHLLKGEMDFAFIDHFSMDRQMVVENVYDETLELCTHPDLIKKTLPKNQRSFYESLNYVEYQSGEPILRMWLQHHLGTDKLNLNVKAYVMDVRAISRFITAGLGAGILPTYVIERLRKEGHSLSALKGSGKPMKNSISVAYLPSKTQSRAAQATLDFLKKTLPLKQTSTPSKPVAFRSSFMQNLPA